MAVKRLPLKTAKHCELIDITHEVQKIISASNISEGICVVFVPHTTAGVTINENADPSVRKDILAELDKIVPQDDNYSHSEGNSAAHIKASMMGSSVTIPIEHASLALGTWQGIYLAEFDGPRHREVFVQVV